uniref:Uncharacterized protein n=1 Tax=Alexandrium catenella TaxID=2925 RepID=A0A7S1WN41_ALECA
MLRLWSAAADPLRILAVARALAPSGGLASARLRGGLLAAVAPQGGDGGGAGSSPDGELIASGPRHRARNTRHRRLPPLRGLPMTPSLPRPRPGSPDSDIVGPRRWFDRSELMLPPPPPLKGTPRAPYPPTWRR